VDPPTPPRSAAPRNVRILTFFAALLPLGWLVWRFAFVTDDAFITFRYALNWAEGLGLVYHPGETPPVEGYSEFLWAILMGLGIRLGWAPEGFSQVLGVISAVLLLVGWSRYASRCITTGPVALVGGALFLGCLPPLAVWSTGGMATMAFCAAVFWLFALTWSEPQGRWGLRVFAVGALAVLLRADGAWWVAWVLGPALAAAWTGGDRQRFKTLLQATGALVGVWGLHVAWRYGYYGDWLPNTARAKVGISMRAAERGLNYLMHFFLVFPGVLLAFLSLGAARGWRERHLGPALCVVLGTALHVVLTGGDFMAYGRFLVPALPFVALLLCAGLSGFEAQGRRAVAAAYALVCCGLVLPAAFDGDVVPERWRTSFGFRHSTPGAVERSEWRQWLRMREQAGEFADLGKALKYLADPGDSVVFGAVGGLGYYSGLRVYDRNGLVSREVALREPLPQATSPGHDKTVPREFFSRYHPTFMDCTWYPGGLRQLRAYRNKNPGVLGEGLKPQDLSGWDLNPRPDQTLLLERLEEN
jgi:arabinofuranosyltransferase